MARPRRHRERLACSSLGSPVFVFGLAKAPCQWRSTFGSAPLPPGRSGPPVPRPGCTAPAPARYRELGVFRPSAIACAYRSAARPKVRDRRRRLPEPVQGPPHELWATPDPAVDEDVGEVGDQILTEGQEARAAGCLASGSLFARSSCRTPRTRPGCARQLPAVLPLVWVIGGELLGDGDGPLVNCFPRACWPRPGVDQPGMVVRPAHLQPHFRVVAVLLGELLVEDQGLL